MLQKGHLATKYGKKGSPHQVLFKLSDDLSTLSWERQGLGKWTSGKWGGGSSDKRSVKLESMVEILIGGGE